MHCKMNGNIQSDRVPSDLLNPFVHHLELSTTYEKIKTGVLTVALLPLRVVAILVLLVTAWLLACVGLVGMTDEKLRKRPIVGWRRRLREVTCAIMRLLFCFAGFPWVAVKGRRAPASEAPVLALAPHSSFFDALPVVCLGAPSVVAKAETSAIFFIGKLINFTQPVYVWRDDPDSRHNTIKEIVDRATSDLDWPQVLIFPEGTCTNRSCLITFKPGAFYPGVPVQPVCIRYPNKLDTVTWTWDGPGAMKLLWLTLTQFNSSCEIEFLPVYHPSKEEKLDPKLYASNVRDLMANALGIPVTDHTYADCLLINKALQLELPSASELVNVHKLRSKLRISASSVEREVDAASQLPEKMLDRAQFNQLMGVEPRDDSLVSQLFKIFTRGDSSKMDVRDYLLDCLLLYKKPRTEEMLRLAFKVMSSQDGDVTRSCAERVLRAALEMSQDAAHKVVQRIDSRDTGFICYEEFVSYARRRPRFAGIFPAAGETEEEQMTDDSGSHDTPPAEFPSRHHKSE